MKIFLKYFAIAMAFVFMAMGDSPSFTIHIVGDSTVCTYRDNAYPQTGWGQVIGYFFDASRVKINNAAIAGRSSRTFIEEGRLDEVAAKLQKGDYLFVQWGHNDRDYTRTDRYVPEKDFPGYIQRYVDKGKAKGANVILISPMNMNGNRNVFSTGQNNYDARGMMQTIAKNNKIPFVDLNMKSYNTYNTTYKNILDYVTRYLYKTLQKGEYPNYPDGVNDGTTHFQEMGSMGHAQMICEELEENLKSNTELSAEAKSALMQLVASLKKRYTITVKTNLSNYNGLITQTQIYPAGSPMTLCVTPNGQIFEKWVDDDCNELSTEQIYYGFKTPARNITYTAMFQGGAACKKIAHDPEDLISSASEQPQSSSSENVVKIAPELCATADENSQWRSPIEMSNPEVGEGTTDSNHEGFTGVGFFNIANSLGSKAVYHITADQSAINAKMLIRYSNGGATARSMKITVDYNVFNVDFPPTVCVENCASGWDVWETIVLEDLWIDALDFNLTIESTTDDGGPNIDMIAFDMDKVYRTGCGNKGISSSSDNVSSSSSKIGTSSSKNSSSSSGIGSSSSGNKASLVKSGLESRTVVPSTTSGAFDALGRRVPGTQKSHARLPRLRRFSR